MGDDKTLSDIKREVADAALDELARRAELYRLARELNESGRYVDGRAEIKTVFGTMKPESPWATWCPDREEWLRLDTATDYDSAIREAHALAFPSDEGSDG